MTRFGLFPDNFLKHSELFKAASPTVPCYRWFWYRRIPIPYFQKQRSEIGTWKRMSEWFEHQENLDDPPSKQIGAIGGGSFLVADLSQKCYFWTFQKSQLFVFFHQIFFSWWFLFDCNKTILNKLDQKKCTKSIKWCLLLRKFSACGALNKWKHCFCFENLDQYLKNI